MRARPTPPTSRRASKVSERRLLRLARASRRRAPQWPAPRRRSTGTRLCIAGLGLRGPLDGVRGDGGGVTYSMTVLLLMVILTGVSRWDV